MKTFILISKIVRMASGYPKKHGRNYKRLKVLYALRIFLK